MSLLNEIKSVLETIDSNVCYGKAFDSYVRKYGWNIIVFNRKSLKVRNKDISREFEIHICRESYIPEGLDVKVIKAIEDKTALRCVKDQDMNFNYIRKGDTDDVVEILTLVFVRADKCQL